ncbi:AAA family ATPase [uncultured Thiodictyon sp.]|uniref:AAA family ATPase n=1 Tax=uncultured Thiodictyon sp. TaxID=1846217 RepID=UPI00342CEC8C
MNRKKLPIGIQTFQKIREADYYYVDETAFAWKLSEEGIHYFLSRPRCFGKSLFLYTLGELFAGNEPLFRGLDVHDRWDWSRRAPVIGLSLGGGVLRDRGELDRRVRSLLRDNAKALGLACSDPQDPAGCFAELIANAHAATGERVVVRVDEYDKPIRETITDWVEFRRERRSLVAFDVETL